MMDNIDHNSNAPYMQDSRLNFNHGFNSYDNSGGGTTATTPNTMTQNEGPRFDMHNDFPALGGQSSNDNSTSFGFLNEEFPALSSLGGGDAQQSNVNTLRDSRYIPDQGSQGHRQPQPQQHQHVMLNMDFQQMHIDPQGSRRNPRRQAAQQQQQQQQQGQQPPAQQQPEPYPHQTSRSASTPPSSSVVGGPHGSYGSRPASDDNSVRLHDNDDDAGQFGLNGLLDLIGQTGTSLHSLYLGMDLTNLGLNPAQKEVLYAKFAYPTHDNPMRNTPDYVLPYCYYMQPPPLKTSHLSKFKLDTLFYIFYNMPKDTLQMYSANELYKRAWQYHRPSQRWVKRMDDKSQNSRYPSQETWVYFNVANWKTESFVPPAVGPRGAPWTVDLMLMEDVNINLGQQQRQQQQQQQPQQHHQQHHHHHQQQQQ